MPGMGWKKQGQGAWWWGAVGEEREGTLGGGAEWEIIPA